MIQKAFGVQKLFCFIKLNYTNQNNPKAAFHMNTPLKYYKFLSKVLKYCI